LQHCRRGAHASLGGSRLSWREAASLHDSCLEPGFDVRIEDKLRFPFDRLENRFLGIMTGAARTKPIAVGFKLRLPLGLQGQFCQSLFTPFDHRWNSQWAALCFSWLGDPDATHGPGRLMLPVLRVNVGRHAQTGLGSDGFHSVYSGCLFALVFLCHPSNGQQQLLQFVNCTSLPTLTGLIDSLLDAQTMRISLGPGQCVPSLTGRVRVPLVPGCFPLLHLTCSTHFPTAVPPSACASRGNR